MRSKYEKFEKFRLDTLIDLYQFGTDILNYPDSQRSEFLRIYEKRNEVGHWIGIEISGY